MPDLFDPLRDLDADLQVEPLPASDVRRRGDRIRRRRAAAQVLGGLAAVAVVVTGTTAVLDGSETKPPKRPVVVTAPEAGWLTEFERAYPLDRGYPIAHELKDASQLGPSQKFAPFGKAGIETCKGSVYPTAHPEDSVGTIFTQPGAVRARELTLYTDSAQAHTVATSLASGYEGCGAAQVTSTNVGDESWAIVTDPEATNSSAMLMVGRVGNAVLLDKLNIDGLLGSSVDPAVQAGQFELLVADMCIFALHPCPTAPDSGPTGTTRVPPLETDLLLTPEELGTVDGIDGNTWTNGPSREDPTLDCQQDWLYKLGPKKQSIRDFSSDDGLGAESSTGVLEFANAKQANAAYDTLSEWIDQCDQPLPGVREFVGEGSNFGGGSSDGVTTFGRTFATRDSRTWIDHQGIALVGKRVVLLSIAHVTATPDTELSADDTFTDALDAAIDRVRQGR